MTINFIGVPLTYGSGKKGVEAGPDTLRENGLIEIAEKYHKIYDLGNIYIPKYHDREIYTWDKYLKFLKPIVDASNNLAKSVDLAMTNNNKAFIIGGDHSLGLGSVAGASNYHKDLDNFSVIWVDAHGDINTPESSPTGNIHGMPLAACMNEGDPRLLDIYFDSIKVRPENVFIIGARDVDPGEFKIAESLGVNLFTMDNVREMGLDQVLNFVMDRTGDKIHLSFDIDSLDSSLVPATGTPVKDGFTMEEAKDILKRILGGGQVQSMDFVEFNPSLEVGVTTLNNCLELLDTIFKEWK